MSIYFGNISKIGNMAGLVANAITFGPFKAIDWAGSYISYIQKGALEFCSDNEKMKGIFKKLSSTTAYKVTPYLVGLLLAYNYPVAAVVGCATASFSELLIDMCENKIFEDLTKKDIENSSYVKASKKLNGFYTQLVAPAIEESIFRGLFQNSLSAFLGRNIGLAVSSVIFGRFHFLGAKDKASIRLQTFYSINAALLGIAFGMIYNTYGLLGSITSHCIHNILVHDIKI